MAQKTLTEQEVAEIRKILTDARSGGTTLAQLVRAHGLAENGCLNATLMEIRRHIRDAIPEPPAREDGKSFAMGVLAGIVAHAILKKLDGPCPR